MKEQKPNKYYEYIKDCGYQISITSQQKGKGYLFLIKDGIRVEGIRIEFRNNRQSATRMLESAKTTNEHTHLSNALGMLVREVMKLKLSKQ